MRLDRRTVLAGGAAAIVVPHAAFAFAGSPAVAARATRLRVVDDRVFVAVVVNRRTTMAVVDSGAELTVLDRDFAAALGLRGGAVATARGTGEATTEATLVGGAEIVVAGLRLRPARVAVIDLGDVSRRLKMARIDVILGRDLFDAAPLAIDLAAGTLAVGGMRPRGVQLPLTGGRGVETLPVTIEGLAAQADFDLGNGGTVLIGAGFASRHRLLDDGRATAAIRGGGIGGATMQTTLALRTLDLAGHRFYDVPAAIDSSPTAADANIGVRLLRRFGIVTDFPNRAVWLDYRG